MRWSCLYYCDGVRTLQYRLVHPAVVVVVVVVVVAAAKLDAAAPPSPLASSSYQMLQDS